MVERSRAKLSGYVGHAPSPFAESSVHDPAPRTLLFQGAAICEIKEATVYFTKTTEPFEVGRSGWTEDERIGVLDVRWWGPKELKATPTSSGRQKSSGSSPLPCPPGADHAVLSAVHNQPLGRCLGPSIVLRSNHDR